MTSQSQVQVPPPESAAAAARQATLLVADTIGEIMGFWNFKPSMGRVWTVLYFSPVPLCADEIAARAELSAGSVSMTLHELLQWKVVRKAWLRGSRKRHFEAETDVLGMVTRVFRERELRMIDDAVDRMVRAVALLEVARAAGGANAELDHLESRLRSLLRLTRTGRAVVDRFANGGLMDLRALRGALRGTAVAVSGDVSVTGV